jgi:lysophospholipase L1-like esterase
VEDKFFIGNSSGGVVKDVTWLFVGDSLIAGGEWQEMFPGVAVDSRGKAGETVAELLTRLKSTVADIDPPDLIFIMSGINNVAMEDFMFLGPYEKIIQMLAARFPRARIVVNSLLPVQLPWLSEAVVPKVNTMLQRLAVQMGVTFLDIYCYFIDERGRIKGQCFLSDGVHLSPRGYQAWAGALAAFLDNDEKRP